MKKGCLIALIAVGALALAALVALGVAYANFNKKMGLSEAPAISHETAARSGTVLRVVLKPESLVPLLVTAIPPGVIPPVAMKLGYGPDKIIPMFMPREAALLATPDLANNKLNLTVFINEKRGGPFLLDAINNGTYSGGQNPLDRVPLIKWSPEGATLLERGALEVQGDLSIPDNVESAILKSWRPTPPVEPLRIEGNHHLEAVLDNRNGNILTIYAALMQANGQDWEAPLNQGQYGPMISANIPDILDIRLAADLVDFDAAKVNLRVDATAEKGPALEFFAKMIWPSAVEEAMKSGITIKGDPVWDAQKGALITDLTVTGIKPMLERALRQKLPGPMAGAKKAAQ